MYAPLASPAEELLSFSPSIPAVLTYFSACVAIIWSAAVVTREAIATLASSIWPRDHPKPPPSLLWSWVGVPHKRIPLSCWFGGVGAGPDAWRNIFREGVVKRQRLPMLVQLSACFACGDSDHDGNRASVGQQLSANSTSRRAAMGRLRLADGVDHRGDPPIRRRRHHLDRDQGARHHVREHVNHATVPHRAASRLGGDTDGASAGPSPASGTRGTVTRMPPALFGIRVATMVAGGFGGVVLLAVGLGAVASRLASPGRVFLVAAMVTTVVAFIGGMLAEPVLCRWAARLRQVGQVGSGAWPRRRR